jgi:hypothetical protein
LATAHGGNRHDRSIGSTIDGAFFAQRLPIRRARRSLSIEPTHTNPPAAFRPLAANQPQRATPLTATMAAFDSDGTQRQALPDRGVWQNFYALETQRSGIRRCIGDISAGARQP